MNEIQVHSAVVLTGAPNGIAAVHRELRQDFRCYRYRDNALMVQDVAVSELPDLERLASAHATRVEQVRGTRGVRIAEEVKQPAAPKLDVLEGYWYRTNQEGFPLIHIIEARNRVDPDGIQLWLFDVDLVGPDAMPQQATLDAHQLKKYKPKPATLEDFEDLDLAAPADFEESPHQIPSVEDEPEKTAGVSLPRAQIAAMALQRSTDYRVDPAVAPATGGGFLVRARVVGKPQNLLPDEVDGTPVQYYR